MENNKLKTGFITHPTPASRKLTAGFTLIETLVAIAILLIAIVAPLSIVGNALNATFLARDQMIATHLAGEAFEIVRQARDTNIMNGDDWDKNFSLDECSSGGNGCIVSVYDPTSGNISGTPYIGKCNGSCTTDIWLNNAGIYGAYVSGSWVKTATNFSRKVEANHVETSKRLKVVVTVSWTTGSQSRSIVFESLVSKRPTL